jgi:hypothetical protein
VAGRLGDDLQSLPYSETYMVAVADLPRGARIDSRGLLASLRCFSPNCEAL